MHHSTRRRLPLQSGRRIALTVSISPQAHEGLSKIEGGNRSAAIEKLVEEYHARAARRTKLATDATT